MTQSEDGNALVVGPQFNSNCLLTAIIFTLGGGHIRTMRNRLGRIHWYWLDTNGHAWEFYAKGRGRSYLRNMWYRGQLRRAPSLDAPAGGLA